jgi:hypothetical protein
VRPRCANLQNRPLCKKTAPSDDLKAEVTADGKPIRASKKSAEWCLKSVDQCWSKKEPAIRAAEKDAYDVARDAYKRILSECPGD